MKKAFIIFALLFFSSCTTTPKLHLTIADTSMELSKPASYVLSVHFSQDGKYAFSGSLDNLVTIWDLETGKEVRTLRVEFGEAPGVSAVSLSRDGRYLLTGMKGGGGVKLWNAVTGNEIRKLPGHSFTEAMEAFAFSPDGGRVMSGGSYLIKQWDAKTGKELGTITHASFFDRNQSYAIAFSPDGRLAFVKGWGFVSLWEITGGSRLWIYGANTGSNLRGGIFNSSAKFSPAGDYVLSGEGQILKLRDLSGRVLRTFIEENSGRIDAVAFSSDGKYALSGSTDAMLRMWNVRTGAKVRDFVGHSAGIDAVSFSPDGRYVLSGGDASTRLWNAATGEELATFIEFDEKEWLVITPEGYYNASDNGARYLNVIVGENRYGVDKFYDVFYRPDIVAAKLKGENIKDLITITMQDAIKSPPPIVEFTTIPSDTNASKVKICYQAKNSGGGIGEVRLFHNGKLIQSDGYYRDMAKVPSGKQHVLSLNGSAIYENMRSVSLKRRAAVAPLTAKSKGNAFEDCAEIEAVSGENEVSVTAFNSGNTVQSYMKTLKFNSHAKLGDPHLYILSIGIDTYKDSSVTLKYAVKDATDIEQKLLKQSATLYKPQNIHYVLLTNDSAGKTSIESKINELSRVIKPQDSFILFVAGHGVLLQNQYYMLTHDYNGVVNEKSMISSNEIVEMSKKIKSLSQLFIFDTCHAGGVDAIVSGLYDARMSVLAKKMGLHIYASASDKQAALDGYEGNGLFTHALLDGLNNNRQADKNKEDQVTVVGLGEYAKQKTAALSKELGHSQTPVIINFGKDNPIYKLK